MMLTLVYLTIWTIGGFYPETHYWSSLSCHEIEINAMATVVGGGGGQYTLYCEQFTPLHEADLNPWYTP